MARCDVAGIYSLRAVFQPLPRQRSGSPVAKYAITILNYAFASNGGVRHICSAFEASSPTNFPGRFCGPFFRPQNKLYA